VLGGKEEAEEHAQSPGCAAFRIVIERGDFSKLGVTYRERCQNHGRRGGGGHCAKQGYTAMIPTPIPSLD
jgi:hypothetical protein